MVGDFRRASDPNFFDDVKGVSRHYHIQPLGRHIEMIFLNTTYIIVRIFRTAEFDFHKMAPQQTLKDND